MESIFENSGFLERFITCISNDVHSRPFLAMAISVMLAKLTIFITGKVA